VLFLDGASCLGINGDPDAGHLGLVQHVEKFGHHRIPFRQIPATFFILPGDRDQFFHMDAADPVLKQIDPLTR
jgi:hypothetical protein